MYMHSILAKYGPDMRYFPKKSLMAEIIYEFMGLDHLTLSHIHYQK